MKKLMILFSIILIYVLSPTSTDAQEARLIAVRVVGGTCGGIINVDVDYFNPGGVASISVGIGSNVVTRSVTSSFPITGTRSFPVDSNGMLILNSYFRVRAQYAGKINEYIFSCDNFELAPDGITPRTDVFVGLARNETREMNVTFNDSSPLLITFVSLIQAPLRGTATVADDKLTVIYTAGDTLGRDSFIYEVCNFKRFTNPALNCGTAMVIVTITNQAPDCDSVAEDSIYVWHANQVDAPFIGIGGVTDPDGDPISVVIDSLTTSDAASNEGIIYTVEYTATDDPPFPGEALSCSGVTLVQKDS